MQHHRTLSWLGVLLMTVAVMIVFYISTKPPTRTQIEETEIVEAILEPTVTFIDPARGTDEPSIVLVELSDLTCSACAEMATNIARLQNELPNDVRHVFKITPNDGASPMAVTTAVAGLCAHEQGRFWEFHDSALANQAFLNETTILTIATNIGLDVESFNECWQDQETLPQIEKNLEEANALSLTALPTLFIGEDRYVGAISYDTLEKTVREKLLEQE